MILNLPTVCLDPDYEYALRRTELLLSLMNQIAGVWSSYGQHNR